MGDHQPRVWVLVGDKPGDNAQIERIAKALEWPYEWKKLYFKPRFDKGKPRFKASVHHIDSNRSDELKPPWPDLILTVGRRPAMAAVWAKQQSCGHSKIVLLGRPKRDWQAFDLVLVPAQYRLPQRPNVFAFGLPLMYPPSEKIAEASHQWRGKLSSLKRPLIAVLVGGVTRPYRFDAATAEKLLVLSRQLAGNGTLYVCTSRRTPAVVKRAISEFKDSATEIYHWGEDRENPYLALLGSADACVVSGDSISMMVEAARLKKPLAIFQLPVRFPIWHRWQVKLVNGLLYQPSATRWLSKIGEVLFAWGLIGYRRDLEQVHRCLLERGAAVILGQGDVFAVPQGELEDALPNVVRRIKGLFG